jgi:hypothetical protein
MNISRRDFLSCAACLPAGSLARTSWRNGRPAAGFFRAQPPVSDLKVLLLNSHCVLEESREGYRAALKAAGAPFEFTSCESAVDAGLILVPAASLTDLNEARWLTTRVAGGATAVIESGGAFVPPSEFHAQQLLVSSQFGLAMLDPVRLWDARGRLNGPAYVDLAWPARTRIRDFSRVVPLRASNAQPIAVQENTVVGLKWRLRAGTLVFLGSPVGPHLLAGDREAQRWFESLLCHATLRLAYSRINSEFIIPDSEGERSR